MYLILWQGFYLRRISQY